jgi:hypothetical protein
MTRAVPSRSPGPLPCEVRRKQSAQLEVLRRPLDPVHMHSLGTYDEVASAPSLQERQDTMGQSCGTDCRFLPRLVLTPPAEFPASATQFPIWERARVQLNEARWKEGTRRI